MTDLYPLLIEPRFDERIWGGHRLADMGTGAPATTLVGEAWEVYAENRVRNGPYAGKTISDLQSLLGADLMGHIPPDRVFPLLTKLIDAREALSVQVHPDNALAQRLEHEPYGKTECWYIIAAEPGAALTYGFERANSPEEYERLVQSGALETILHSLPVKPGDVVYIPAGTVHAIGAGILLFELQQTSDTTYRIYDWGRVDAQGKPRQLHVDKASQVLDYHRETRGLIRPLAAPDGRRSMLVGAPYFTLELDTRGGAFTTHDSPVALCTLDHPIEIRTGGQSASLAAYASALIPAACGTYQIEGDGRVLTAYVPASSEVTRRELAAWGYSDREIDTYLAQFAPAAGLGLAAS